MKLLPLLFAAFLGCGALAARAATVTLGAVKDNTIFSDTYAELSDGQGPFLYSGRNANDNLRRALLAFDLSAVPAGSTITGVTLTLAMDRTPVPDAFDFSIYRLLANWGEGASNSGTPGGGGAPAQPGDATWTRAIYPGTTWSTPGGTFAATASATTSVGVVGSYQWTSPQMIADVQNWVNNPATNFGWLLKDDESAFPAKRFVSAENTVVGSRPALVVTYETAAADSDGDGLPDNWELANFGNLTTANATSDFDGDGTSDLSEYLAGTSPVNPAENFHATISRNGAQLHAAVTEHAATGNGYAGLTRRYDWLSSSRTPPLIWRPATGVVASSGGVFTLDAPLAPDTGLLFRCESRLETTPPAPPPAATRIPAISSNSRYCVYYGADFSATNLALLAQFDLVVLETAVAACTPAVVAELQRRGVKYVIGYISIGEEPAFVPVSAGDGTGPVHFAGGSVVSGNNGVASFYVDQAWNGAAYITDGQPDVNGGFGSRYVNPNAAWRALIDAQRINGVPRSVAGLAQLAGRRSSDTDTDRSHNFGFDGFFLDTLDTAGPYANAAGYYAWTAPAMRDTVKFVRESYPGKIVFANRGLFFFNPGLVNPTYNIRPYDYSIRPYIHALLVESYYLDSNPANTGVSPYFGDNKNNFAQKIIAEANRPDGFTVFSLDYQMNRGAALYAQAVNESVVQNGWVGYLSPDGTLDPVGTFVRDNPPPPDTAAPVWDSTGSPPFSPGDVPDRIGIQKVSLGAQPGSVVIHWDVARDQTPPVKYHVYRSADAGFASPQKYSAVAFQTGDGWGTDPTTAFANKTTITGLADGTYYFRVHAEDSAVPPHEDANTATLSITVGPVADRTNPVGTLTIDGSLADWTGTTAYPLDPDDITGAQNPLDWRELRAAHNATTFYLAYTTDPPAALTAAHNTFLDTDRSRGTGFRGGGDNFPIGADFMIQGGTLYHYTGTGTNWSWASVAAATSASGATTTEIAIPWSLLDNTTSLDFFLYGDNPSVGGDTVDYYPDNAPQTGGGGGFFRYHR